MPGDSQTQGGTSSTTERELQERLGILATFNEVIADVNETIVDASARADIEQQVCERLVQTDELRFAWVGVVDDATDAVEPRTWAGVEDGYLDEMNVSVAASRPGGNGPVGRAIRTNSVQTTHSIPDDSDFGPFREIAVERGYRSAASVPLVYDDTRYGVLTMYAEHEGAFTPELVEPVSNLGHAVAHGIDTHVRRERERELERREEIFSRIVEDIEEYAIFRLDADGCVESWNRGATAIKGYSIDDILGEHIRTFYTDENREAGRPSQLLERARREGRVEDEGWLVRADGTRFWAAIAITALTDDDGKVNGFAKVTRDMTERKRREQQLDAVFNSTFQYIGLVEPDGTVLKVNDAALDLVNADRDDIVGLLAWETPWWNGDEERMADLQEALDRAKDGEFVRYEVEVDGSCGDRAAVIDFSVTPVFEDGAVSLLVLEGHDITTRKERERELRREQERLEFVNRIIRHNLLNGLNVVGARADIVGDFVEPAGQTHLDTIQNRVREMTDLVGTMRTFMKVIVERESHETHPRPIHEAVEHGVKTLRTESHDVSVSVSGLSRISVVADDLLDEVIEHLLKNAVQHNDKLNPEVTVEVAPGDEVVELRVSDNGPGIPDEEKHRIVDKRIEDLSNPGNGFGLFLVREIVESYGGEIRIEDNEPSGATFVVTLPRA
ncbi:PAS domain S-box protein [Haloferax mediterranei ATCC 33500]|uniref:histidine kinase n=1 Tax=Haloferax mediterranei (strain ATCC 33500 / DSM 1411 / JCM 8866 / NBRC 14739 / NCIMB 2177 / R-4) TaxID=523841 RepID=I3R4I5_HALMT|nr:PAS domain S-box protein [Haloferax mediterranei]AFK19145.1 PAS domain S-box [Haloferax mediterranei ATCC 33500]AHZ21493.1 bacterio-opsin activator [Haloferax mediterranei ATCC 33500]EMA03954.1 PAS domain-containing protein [Haloferax mediterranei ATCC 33500]MDX5989242.1 PAS domain S-box protein [Haloferax mediterranei ATCC 33500]QCQ75616.1 PAS domain S-box protein [Haloferax mediterranei ATCC 33500]